jgi:hypothetical protein
VKNRAYKYRFTPTEEQATLLAKTFGVSVMLTTLFCVGVQIRITKAKKKSAILKPAQS